MPPAAILGFLYAEPDPIDKLMWPSFFQHQDGEGGGGGPMDKFAY